MDYAALAAALPAAIVAAVATTPQGLTTAAQVTVYEHEPTASETVLAWARPSPENPVIGVRRPGGTLTTLRFEVRVRKAGATRAELRTWGQQLMAYFNGAQKPAGITDLHYCVVSSVGYDPVDASPDPWCSVVLDFVGLERPA